MILRKLKAGLVFTQSTDLTPYINFLSKYVDVQPILHTYQSSRLDLIIIPDVGVSPILPQFASSAGFPIPTKPVCQYVELFRSFGMDYYLDNDTPIIGVGEAMCINWKGKCTIYNGKQVCCPTDNKEIIQSTNDFIITSYENLTDNTYGVDTLNNPLLIQVIRELTRINNGDGMQAVSNTVIIPPIIPVKYAANINTDTDDREGSKFKSIN